MATVFKGSTIADLDLNSDKLDSIFIRLTCGHIFTVETLDGICELRKFYSSTPDGYWTGLCPPPAASAAVPPTCPTCRGTITARRYGRVCKRANLDMLERTVAAKMSRELNELGNRAAELLVWSLRDEYSEAEIPDKGEPCSTEQQQNLEDIRQNDFKNELPLNHDCLWSLELHGITKEESEVWNRLLKPLLQLYKAVVGVAATRSAHGAAYGAALSMLYTQEVTALNTGPQPPSSPEATALTLAKQLVGTGPPHADKRFRVEAIWLSVELRYVLGSIALSRLRRIHSVARNNEDQRVVVWAAFIDFVFKSCVHDTYLARKITADCGAPVQSLDAVAMCCRAVLEHAKANCSVDPLLRSTWEEKSHWTSEAERLRAHAELFANDERCAFFARRGNQSPEMDLVEDRLMKPVNLVLGQWDELITGLSSVNFVGPPPSKAELSAIVKKFPNSTCSLLPGCCVWLLIILSLAHRGHWCSCPNGHAISISECGVVQESKCNECGEAIGGWSHNLLQSDQNMYPMEDTATQQDEATPRQSRLVIRTGMSRGRRSWASLSRASLSWGGLKDKSFN